MGPEQPGDRTKNLDPEEGERILRFSNLAPGALFAGRYRLADSIGAGGSGEVFRAIDEVTSTPVAVKVLFPGAGQPDLERLQREIRLVRQLTHPGILKVFDIGVAEGLRFTVSELLEGESLGQRLAREGPLPPGRAEEILREIFQALGAAHAEGVVHRDIKPGNIFIARPAVSSQERVVLLDFGLARPAAGPGMTTVGRFLGTPQYCSPEQVRGDAQIGPASDLYSCGVILWEMLAGSPPFEADSEVEILNAHLHHIPHEKRGELRRVPRHLKDLVFRLLEKKPSRRPRNAAEALEQLRPKSAVSMAWSMTARWARQTPWVFPAGFLLITTIAAAASYRLFQPLSVTPQGPMLTWTTTLGPQFHSGPYSRPVAAAALDQPLHGPFSGVFLGLENTPPEKDPNSPFRSQPVIQYQPTPFSFPKTLYSNSEYFFWRSPFPGFDTPLKIQGLIPLGRDKETDDPLLCVHSRQDSAFATVLDFLRGNSQLAVFIHPGYFNQWTVGSPVKGGPPFIFAIGDNNQASLHVAAMGIPASVQAAGQAPPFRAPLDHEGRAGGWYTFLPFHGEGLFRSIQLRQEILEFRYGSGAQISLRAVDGVPVDQAVRGGLSMEKWAERREELIQGFLRASQEEQTGSPERGGEILEEWARKGGGGPEMFSIALYRASQLHMLSAWRLGRPAYDKALADIQESRRYESQPSRARLLHAELMARLENKDRFAEIIRGWGRFPEVEHYVYEWLLVSWLGGLPSPPEGMAGFWNAQGYTERGWGLAYQMVDFFRRGLFDLPEKKMAAFNNSRLTFDFHFFWLARAALDRPDPQPGRALEWLEKARNGQKQGWFLPLRISEIWAKRLQTSLPTPKEELREAREELEQLSRLAAGDLHARILLPFAARDLKRLAQVEGDSALAAQADQAIDQNPLDMP